MFKRTLNQLVEKVIDIQNIAHPRRPNSAHDLGRTGGHTEYTRFIILGRSRSGSNFLRGLLNSHRRVTTFGELFQNEATISWGLSDYPQSPQLLTQFQNDPIEFLETQVFCRVPKSIQAVGFKLFYYHAHGKKWQPIWDYLAAQPALKVIHIKRDNLLKVHLSRKRAMLTDRWVNLSGTPDHYAPIALDYTECLRDFSETQQWEKEYAHFFARQHQLEIHYEALLDNYQKEMDRVQNFLGIESEVLIPETYRQSDDSLSTSIANYHELKAMFRGTAWHAYFEE